MIWLTSSGATAATLPAVWLLPSRQRPANLGERSALRHKIALDVLASQLALPRDAVRIAHDARGRPLLTQPAGTELQLSLATRSGLVALALAHRPVGVDVERIDPLQEQPLSVLHPREQAALRALDETARPLVFARLWCAKEAYVKALGLGFVRAPDSFAVSLDTSDRFSISDAERPGPIVGASVLIENGGQESLAAAVVVLG